MYSLNKEKWSNFDLFFIFILGYFSIRILEGFFTAFQFLGLDFS